MNRIIIGDCRETMRALLAEGVKVQTCVTSPPYFGLRDYGHPGQMGLERTPDEYVANMVEVFRLVRDLLADDGTLWLNLGDSYVANRGNTEEKPAHDNKSVHTTLHIRKNKIPGKPKDLIGIPWRVAFALQQPYYTGNIKSEIDRAWLAALVDGEGCITVLEATSPHGSGSSYPPVLQVRMCDVDCIQKAAQITGYGSASPPQDPPSQGGQRPSYQWRLHGRKAADTIAEIYPFLLIKRKQAIVAWNLQAVRDGYETKRGVKIPADDLAKQLVCRDLAQRLNRREAVDIPSWMIEPPQPIEPGYYLRQDLIWSKPNPMPESVRDRCTKSHEYLFLLSKNERYYFDQEAIAEPVSQGTVARYFDQIDQIDQQRGSDRVPGKTNGPMKAVVKKSGNKERKPGAARGCPEGTGSNVCGSVPWEGTTRNKRSVWTVTTKPYSGAHFATFPPDLIEPCVLAGSPAGGIVFDPFMGSGTTAEVAQRLGRQYLGCELNPEYEHLQRARLQQPSLSLG